MPVQINEVIIRAVVENTSGSNAETPQGNKANSKAIQEADIASILIEVIKEKNQR